ncbi:MAG: hypothetical protein IJG24_01675, partial [Selenomonadaceae bacterium]|nr:hypothetical protein [Selenomonadaceae bacterium]
MDNNNFNMDTAGDDSSEFIENTVKGATIQTGANDDTIKNVADNVSINSGAGNDSISNYGSHVTINGGSGNNTILSYDDEDVIIIGGAGNDVINLNSGAKNNSIYYSAGDGSDTIYGFDTNDDLVIDSSYSTQVSGNDLLVNVGTGSIKLVGATRLSSVKINKTLINPVFITLTESADTYVNELDNATINALGGSDHIDNSGAYVLINGGTGHDYINNTEKATWSTLTGGAGNDNINNNGSNVIIDGGSDNDSIYTYAANATVDAGTGNDYVYNTGSNVSINGGAGNDSLKSYGSKVTLVGGAGDDSISNGGGTTESSNVTIDAGAGNDIIYNGWNTDVSVSGGAGNDSISNVNGKYATLSGGAGNDTIVNNSADVTIEGGTGDDSISSAGNNVVFVYSQGDGSDTIDGFNSYSTLQIGDGTGIYSKEIVNNDVIVTVEDGTITLKNAGKLSTVNIAGTEKYDWSMNAAGTAAVYGNAQETLITVSGVKSISGISIRDKIVTIPATVLNDTNVTVSDGYTLATSGISSPSTTNAWSLNGTNANYVQTTTAGYSLSSDGKSISYTPNSSKTLATVSGVKSVSGISLSGKVVNVPASALNGTNVTVSDGYTLLTNGTAPSTTAAWSLSGTNANYVQTTTAGYTLSSDAKSISYTPSTSETLATVSGVKSVSGISLSGKVVNVPAAALNGTNVTVSDGYTLSTDGAKPSTTTAWSLSGTNANYVQTTTAGYTLSSDGKSISYTPSTSETLATVSGVKSVSGISLSGKVVNVPAAALNATNVTVSDGYTLTTDGAKPSTKNAWSLSGTNANYVQTTTAGYTLSSDAKSISYTPSTSETLATVSGVKSVSGISLSGKVVNVPAAALNGTNVTVSEGYTLSTDGTAPSTTAAWSLSGTNANYVQTTTAGYTLASDGKSISYTPNSSKTLATVSGVKSVSGISLNGKVVNIPAAVLNATNVTVSDGYTLTTDGAKPSTTNAWSLSGTNANYVQTTTAGYTLSSDAKSISYTPNSSKTLATVSGVKSVSGISLSGKVVNVPAAALNATNVTVSDGYTLTTDGAKPSTKNA